ncbi:MAG: septal ring lytic transglycosylase RlpA family protein [Polyangia bacterium]
MEFLSSADHQHSAGGLEEAANETKPSAAKSSATAAAGSLLTEKISHAAYQTGDASYYGTGTPAEKRAGKHANGMLVDGFATRKMANGEPMNPNALSVAHRTLPLGSHIHIRNVANGKGADVVVEDRGPYAKSRILDGSPKVAEELDYLSRGHAKIEIFKK